MGLFNFFSKDPQVKIDRLVKKMLNEHQQQPVRQEALEELVSMDTPSSILALVRRLGVNFRDTIKNEQEKRWVTSALIDHFGQRAVDPLSEFIRTNQTISGAIIALTRLIDEEQLIGLLVEVLTSYEPADHRTIAARGQILDAFTDHQDPRIVPAVTRYAMDHDDDVRYKAMQLMQERADRDDSDQIKSCVEQLVEVLDDPEAPGRITRCAADSLIALDADLGAYTDKVEDNVPDGYALSDGKLSRR